MFERQAIPDLRIRYFTDPTLNIGLSKSRKEVFESNGTSGADILSHPHFLRHLKYFIYGPDLPVAAIHAFCEQGEFRGGERFSRHWHDLTRLDRAGIANVAMADRPLAQAVARHKSVFFAEKKPSGQAVDYAAAVSGGLRLVPDDKALASLSLDYERMIEDGLLLDDAEMFEELMQQCRDLQARANRSA